MKEALNGGGAHFMESMVHAVHTYNSTRTVRLIKLLQARRVVMSTLMILFLG